MLAVLLVALLFLSVSKLCLASKLLIHFLCYFLSFSLQGLIGCFVVFLKLEQPGLKHCKKRGGAARNLILRC